MRRRGFITLLGGAAAAWPLAARGQQPDRMRRIGVLMFGDENDYDQKARLSGFMQSLAKSGWADSRNLLIDVRWTAANLELVRRHAKELVALKPDVLVATSTPVTAAFQYEAPAIDVPEPCDVCEHFAKLNRTLLRALRLAPYEVYAVPPPSGQGFLQEEEEARRDALEQALAEREAAKS
jgi:hypothetical protein